MIELPLLGLKAYSGAGTNPNQDLIDLVDYYYKLDENIANGDRADSGPNALTMTDVLSNVDTATGNTYSIAAKFNNDGGRLKNTSGNAALKGGSANDFTLSLWVYEPAGSSSGHAALISRAGGVDYWFYVDSVTQYGFYAGGGHPQVSGRTLDAWHHLVATHKASDHSLQLILDDGVPVTGTGTPADGSGNFWIGSDSDVATWSGRIGNVSKYHAVLTAAQITRLYNSGSGLALY